MPVPGGTTRKLSNAFWRPAEELVALAVALELEARRCWRSAPAMPNASTCTEWSITRSHRHERVDARGSPPSARHRLAHRGEVDDGGHAGEVLQQHARGRERHLGLGRRPRASAASASTSSRVTCTPADLAEQVLEQDLDRERQRGRVAEAELGEAVEAVVGGAVLELCPRPVVIGSHVARPSVVCVWTGLYPRGRPHEPGETRSVNARGPARVPALSPCGGDLDQPPRKRIDRDVVDAPRRRTPTGLNVTFRFILLAVAKGSGSGRSAKPASRRSSRRRRRARVTTGTLARVGDVDLDVQVGAGHAGGLRRPRPASSPAARRSRCSGAGAGRRAAAASACSRPPNTFQGSLPAAIVAPPASDQYAGRLEVAALHEPVVGGVAPGWRTPGSWRADRRACCCRPGRPVQRTRRRRADRAQQPG